MIAGTVVNWRAWNFLVSIVAAVGVVILLWVQRSSGHALLFALLQPLFLPFLWFAETLGDWIGIPPMPGGLGSRPITSESPPLLVLAFAWLIFASTAALLFHA